MADEIKANGSDGKTTAVIPKLPFGRVMPAGHAYARYEGRIPAGTRFETICAPTYWVHYARFLRPGDIVECFCEDGTWEAELRVMFVSPAEIKVAVRLHVSYGADVLAVSETGTHEVKWISPPKKFGVVRKDTGEVIKDGFYPKEKAVEFMQQHLKRVGV